MQLRAGVVLTTTHAVFAVTHLAGLARLLPERDPHESVYHSLDVILDHLDDPALAAALVVRFELLLLSELGFGLDLASCAATGALADLAYVSPRTGRAVSHTAGEAWRDRLLVLPAFLREGFDAHGRPPAAELRQGFALTSFFLARHVFEPRGLAVPDARQSFIGAIARALPDAA